MKNKKHTLGGGLSIVKAAKEYTCFYCEKKILTEEYYACVDTLSGDYRHGSRNSLRSRYHVECAKTKIIERAVEDVAFIESECEELLDRGFYKGVFDKSKMT